MADRVPNMFCGQVGARKGQRGSRRDGCAGRRRQAAGGRQKAAACALGGQRAGGAGALPPPNRCWATHGSIGSELVANRVTSTDASTSGCTTWLITIRAVPQLLS